MSRGAVGPEGAGDVIVAAATPLGRSALAVVRLTGPGCLDVVRSVATPLGDRMPPRRPVRVTLADAAGTFDDGLLWWARGPRTVTGEDVVEITTHGNPVVVEALIDALVAAGARVAEPGEFTRRAVVHGKMDLVAAEGVLHAVEASSRAGLAIARQGLDGVHARTFADLREGLCALGAELEARLDLPADELALMDDAAVVSALVALADRARGLAETYEAGRRAVDGAHVALVGAVNAGKSSLFNALLGRRRALVHAQAGTTRDVLEVRTTLGGVAVTLMDTAGERVTDDPVEAAGLALARELVADADLLVVVLRARSAMAEVERRILERTRERRRIVVYNGVDAPGIAPAPAGAIPTIATTGAGVDILRHAIADALRGVAPATGEVAIASARQRQRLLDVARAARDAAEALAWAGPAVAADLVTEGVAALDALSGADPRESVLDALFARFCIGK